MPHRTNSFQELVHLLELAAAREGCSVRESAMLLDKDTKELREVDVLIEDTLAGHKVRIAVEIIDHSRPADVQWVEKMHSKFESIQIDGLILVSKKGFTKQALKKAHAYGHEAYKLEELDSPDWTIGIPRILTGILERRGSPPKITASGEGLGTSGLQVGPKTEVSDSQGEVLSTLGEYADTVFRERIEPANSEFIRLHFFDYYRTRGDLEKNLDITHIYDLEEAVFVRAGSTDHQVRRLRFEVSYAFTLTEVANNESIVKLGDKEGLVTEATVTLGDQELMSRVVQLRGQDSFVATLATTDRKLSSTVVGFAKRDSS